MNTLVILPTQLFDVKFIPEYVKNIVIWEHPHYFKKYNYNKKKIMLHIGSMEYYHQYLKSHKYTVEYVNYGDQLSVKKYFIFDPVDKIRLPGKKTILDSPNFLLTMNDMTVYRNKTDKFFFNAFYLNTKKMHEDKKLHPLKSTDSKNRKSINKKPERVKIPDVPTNKQDVKFISKAATRTNKEFKSNYGNIDNFIFPMTHGTAKKWLSNFVSKKLKQFGPYQDAIDKNNPFLFHSLLSTSLNIGLINPNDVITEVMRAKNIPINSREGLIRQLYWREYQRYCYVYCNWYNIKSINYFNNSKTLTKKWYDGTTGIDPVDDCIKKAFTCGYLHHIERLMIMGNYMNLSRIKPFQGYKWFMEFSCDSYDWVMHQNVYEMVFFVSGGMTTRKPYVSSSNYILNMSNYRKGDWSETWDKLYREFVKNNKKKLWKFRYHFGGLKNV